MSELVSNSDKVKIHVLSDGERWGLSGEVRLATSVDVCQFREWDVRKGQIISVLDNGDFEISGNQWTIDVTAEEFTCIEEGGKVRHVDGYDSRIVSTGPLTFEKWVERYSPMKQENGEPQFFEHEQVLEKSPGETNVWTYVQGEDGDVILAGYHFVNRLGYYITEHAFTAEEGGDLFVLLENICNDEGDEEDDLEDAEDDQDT